MVFNLRGQVWSCRLWNSKPVQHLQKVGSLESAFPDCLQFSSRARTHLVQPPWRVSAWICARSVIDRPYLIMVCCAGCIFKLRAFHLPPKVYIAFSASGFGWGLCPMRKKVSRCVSFTTPSLADALIYLQRLKWVNQVLPYYPPIYTTRL